MTEPTTGRFVWHDIMTTDPEASMAFYTKLFDWEIVPTDMGPMGTYNMIKAGENTIGGFVALDSAENIPSHWIAYVSVDDVDAATDRANSGGGTTAVPGTDIPGIGRFAVIRDPQGAPISPFSSAHPPSAAEEEDCPAVGTVCWNELMTSDPEASARFYGELFGWTRQEVPMGEMGTYHLFKRGEKDAAGMMQMPPGTGAPTHWLSYVLVEDVDASAAKATELGAKTFMPPTDIPGIGRFSAHADPTGAAFALFKGTGEQPPAG